VKVYVDADELYPLYSVSETPFGLTDEVEVDEKTFKRWTKAYATFHAVQDEVGAAVESAKRAVTG
jgi:hypothetical protein